VSGQERVQELLNRSRLPDPCTLVFGVPKEAPPPVDAEGRSWSVEHWIHGARRQGHSASRVDSRTGVGVPTWCGDIDIDGLTYQVHRGPRKRVLALYVDNDGTEAGRFELQESAWVEPVPPDALPNTCPWCNLGPPRALRLVAEHETDDVYLIATSESPDGSGRGITIQTNPDYPDEESEPYCITLEPGHATRYGGIANYTIAGDQLNLQLTPAAARELRVDPNLTFDLAVDDQQLAALRAGLQRTLSAHPSSSV
jgi:Immunity protein 10